MHADAGSVLQSQDDKQILEGSFFLLVFFFLITAVILLKVTSEKSTAEKFSH